MLTPQHNKLIPRYKRSFRRQNRIAGIEKVPRITLLWEFLQVLLNDKSNQYCHVICWQDRYGGIFKIVDPARLAQLWGQYKNIAGMTYDKMSRSLRNYYKTNKLKKVAGQRQVYQFIFSVRNPPLNLSLMDAKMRQFVQDNKKFKADTAEMRLSYEERLDKMRENLQTYLATKNPQTIVTNEAKKDSSSPFTMSTKSETGSDCFNVDLPLEIDIKEEKLTE